MNSKQILVECLDCGEAYLGDKSCDTLCEGYKCTKCGGNIYRIGVIEKIEEDFKDIQNKINRTKENGLIRKYIEPLNIPCDGHIAELPFDKCMHGVDLGSEKDTTSMECIYKNTIKIKDVIVIHTKEELSYLVTYDRAFDYQHIILINTNRHLSDNEIKEMLHQNCPVCEKEDEKI